MRKTIKNLLERNATKIAIFITITIAYLSLKTLKIVSPISISYFDKVLHFTAYFSLTLIWLFAQREKNNKFRIIILLFLYGILLEFCQEWFNQNRTKDLFDIFANTLGIIFAALLFRYFYKYYKKIFVYHN